ncbi:hypothetical protein QYE76_057942 [Lolium multiflorum]|uniref:DUF8039 domain-containing protein n=1 Tax=Lolium multiflorum TaxID=4521 RepID=A0AAD8T649_LOLMU|nr:hypothetical protein QYE76_057942 [Lolium multiflorum]
MMEDDDEEEEDDDMYPNYGDTATGHDEDEEAGGGDQDEEASDEPVDDDLRRAIADAHRDAETENEKRKLKGMLDDHKKKLYPNCEDGNTKLGATLELLQWKAEAGICDKPFEKLLKIMKRRFPKDNELPDSTYEAKKVLCPLGLEVLKIHACINDCILYRLEYENLEKCPVCNALRYKIRRDDPGDVEGEPPRKRVPAKVMWYAPIIPRLKRLFRNKEHARLLRWHKEDRKKDEKLRHPADGSQWRKIDREFPDFAEDARNLRGDSAQISPARAAAVDRASPARPRRRRPRRRLSADRAAASPPRPRARAAPARAAPAVRSRRARAPPPPAPPTAARSGRQPRLETSRSTNSTGRTKRGAARKMEDHERCTITEIAIDGEPISPKKFAKKFVSQCGVVVRDTVPITTQEWKKPVKGGEGVTYVDTRLKSVMFRKLLINFIFPEPTDSDSENDRPDPEDPELNSVQRRVKKWALKKMAVQFNDYKKKLDSFFVKKGKTPDFKGPYEKIKDHWEEFVKLKKSDKAKKRSDTNTKNASNKMYFHTMGRGGYNAGRPKWEKWENELIKKGIQPEVLKWNQRSRDWFYAHGGTLDAQGLCIYTQRHKENPLPIEAFRNVAKEVEEGKFRPEREKDQLTRALGNPEHSGRTRTTSGGKPWCIGFPAETKKYPDRSRQRQKDVVHERVAKLEEQVRMIMSGSVTVTQPQPNPQIEEVAFDATGQGSQRKSSVASTELPGDDAHVDPQMAPPSPVEPQMDLDLYPVDFITESTPCELHFQTMGYLTLKAAVGYVLPPVPDQRYHFKPVPPGYAVAGVDQVMDGYGPLRLDHPAGEGDLLELGEAKNTTVLWRKEFIVIPGWKAPTRSPPRQHSPPMQPSPVREPSPPAREPSPPTREPSPPPREPSPPPQPKSKSKIRRSATTQLSRNRSPRRKQEPLPRVPKVPPKRPYDYTVEENAKIVAEQHKQQMLKLKKPQLEPEPAISLEKKLKLLKNLHQPEPSLSSNYDRSIRKSNVSARDRWEKSKVDGKPVPQLGNQKNSCPPLQVYPDVTACFDPEMVRLYKDEADAVGMSIPEYLSRIDAEFLTSTGDDVQIAYQYKYGQPLVRAEELPNLSTQLRRLHNWYMEKCKDGKNWIMVAITDEHYGRNDVMNIEFCELFQLFNQDTLDKSLLSAYCLMKIRECRKGQIYDLGFVDPYTVNGFHYILLVIEPDTGIVEVMDSKSKPLEAWGDMADILLKAWKRFTNKSPGLKNKELRIKHVPCLRQEDGNNLCGYYVCEFIRQNTHHKRDILEQLDSLCRGSVLVQFPAAAESAAAGKGTKILPFVLRTGAKASPPSAPQPATWRPL